MKRARIVVFGIALVAAAGAAILAKGFIGKPPKTKVVTTNKVDSVQVLVANKDLQLGDTIGGGDVKWTEWPREIASGSYIRRNQKPTAMTDLSGAIVRAPFLSGEPIREQKLIKASDGGIMAAILPAGKRAVAVKIDHPVDVAGNFILPNDRVDVILSRKIRTKGGRNESHVADTLLRNVKVLAIGTVIESKGDAKTVDGKTATLELTPRQAETIALASIMGDIFLSLRSLTDSRPGLGETNDGREVLNQERGTSVRLLRYGVKSRAYGVN